MNAIIVAAVSMVLAPAPVYKPLTPEQQKAMLKSAELDIRHAEDAIRESKEKMGRTKIRNAPPEVVKGRRVHYRSAAEKLGRVHADLPAGGRPRADVGFKAALIWGKAGDRAKSLTYYDDVATNGPDAEARLLGLAGVVYTSLALGKKEGAAEALKKAEKEMAGLGEKDRLKWQQTMRGVQGPIR